MKYLFITLLLIGCNSSKEITNSDNLFGNYQVEFIEGVNRSNPVIKNITLNLNNNSVSGNGGCNIYGGKAVVKENTIRFNECIATQMYCDKASIAESVFMKNLTEVNNYKIENDYVILLRDKTLLIKAKKVKK